MEIVKIADIGVDAAAAKAAGVIAQGGIVVYPTDTLYGIGVNALSADALTRLQELKGRDKQKPVSVLLPSVDAIEAVAVLSPEARTFAEKHFPGALTLVLPAKERVPKELAPEGMVGIRVPDDAFALTLAQMSEFPVTATSANLAGQETKETIPELMMHFGAKIGQIDLFVDDGARESRLPSTVVAYAGEGPKIIREGKLSKESLGL